MPLRRPRGGIGSSKSGFETHALTRGWQRSTNRRHNLLHLLGVNEAGVAKLARVHAVEVEFVAQLEQQRLLIGRERRVVRGRGEVTKLGLVLRDELD